MPLYQLTNDLVFPRVELALPEGLLAVGGDLSVDRLLLAYSHGIFPWYGEGDPIMWWSPDPRMVLIPRDLHVSRSLRRLHRKRTYRLTLDTAFPRVITACADAARPGQDGTWITRDMEQAYIDLHDAGYAHSVEVWSHEQLVGGLYGVSLGHAFFGESMFSRRPDTSKLAMWSLVEQIRRWDFSIVDCQMHTQHLARLGARDMPRAAFLGLLNEALEADTRPGPWSFDPDLLESMD